MLADDIDDALAALDEILERVFCVVDATSLRDDEERWVMVDYLRVRVWGEVRGFSCFEYFNDVPFYRM